MRTFIYKDKAALLFIVLAGMLVLTGCSSVLKDRIVDLRNAQADSALQDDKIVEAEKEYGLALALAPNDEHARAGFAHAAYLHAKSAIDDGDIDTAQIEIQKSLKYSPKDAAALDLAAVIDQARIRRDVVVANFPAYRASSDVIRDLLKANALTNKNIQQQIHLFNADYDAAHLRKAIALSTDLEEEDHRVTQRLIALRSEIEAVAPGMARPAPAEEVPGLLPIP